MYLPSHTSASALCMQHVHPCDGTAVLRDNSVHMAVFTCMHPHHSSILALATLPLHEGELSPVDHGQGVVCGVAAFREELHHLHAPRRWYADSGANVLVTPNADMRAQLERWLDVLSRRSSAPVIDSTSTSRD